MNGVSMRYTAIDGVRGIFIPMMASSHCAVLAAARAMLMAIYDGLSRIDMGAVRSIGRAMDAGQDKGVLLPYRLAGALDDTMDGARPSPPAPRTTGP